MIKTNCGTTEIKGNSFEVLADLTMILVDARKMLSEELGEEEATIRLKDTFDIASVLTGDVEKDIKTMTRITLERILETELK